MRNVSFVAYLYFRGKLSIEIENVNGFFKSEEV